MFTVSVSQTLVTRQRPWQGRKSTHTNLPIFHTLASHFLEQKRLPWLQEKTPTSDHVWMNANINRNVISETSVLVLLFFTLLLEKKVTVKEWTFVQRGKGDHEGGYRWLWQWETEQERRVNYLLPHFHHLCFLLPRSSQQLLSTTSFFPSFIRVLCAITSNTFQYPHSPTEHLKGRVGTWASASCSSSAATAIRGCAFFGLRRHSPPTEAGEDGTQGSAPGWNCGEQRAALLRSCSCGPLNSTVQQVLCRVVLALPL